VGIDVEALLEKWSFPLAAFALCLITSPSTSVAISGGSIVLCLPVCEILVPRGE
jgi:hypothetical protein